MGIPIHFLRCRIMLLQTIVHFRQVHILAELYAERYLLQAVRNHSRLRVESEMLHQMVTLIVTFLLAVIQHRVLFDDIAPRIGELQEQMLVGSPRRTLALGTGRVIIPWLSLHGNAVAF